MVCRNVVFSKFYLASRHVIEKHSHFNYQCLKCRKLFSRRCYNHNQCYNLQLQDFALMDPEGEREGAAAKLTEWKKSKMPNLVQKVKSGFLTELRRLQTEYGPTPCEYNKTESVKSSEITSMDIDTDLKIMIKNPISPVQSPKRNVLIKNMDLEEISDEELDFVDTDAESKTQKQTKETNKHKMNNNIETSDTSSSSSSSSSSDSSSETSSSESSVVPKKKVTNSRKRRRSWKRFCTSLSDTSSDSDSDSDSALVETKKKKKRK